LDVVTEHGEHSKTTVLDLFNLEFGELILVLAEFKRVEWSSRVHLVERSSIRKGSVGAEGFCTTHQNNLSGSDGNDGRCMDELRRVEVVDVLVVEDKGTSLEPHRLFEANAVVDREDLREDASERTKHSPTSMEKLSLTVAGKALRVSREAKSVPSIVSRVFTGKVVRDSGEESIR